MNWVINFMLVLLLYSCASTQQSDNLDFEFDSISNEDFKVIEEVPYREHEDVFEDVEVNDDSLAKESMARVSEPKLMVVENLETKEFLRLSLDYQIRKFLNILRHITKVTAG